MVAGAGALAGEGFLMGLFHALRIAKPQVSDMRVRLRLTLLYGGLFVLSGAVLLAITYLLVEHGSGSLVVMSTNGQPGGPVAGPPGAFPERGGNLPPAVQAMIDQAHEQALQQHAEIMHRLLAESGVALATMSVVAIALGWLVAGRVLRPLRTMTQSIQQISARNVHERLAAEGPKDELKNLSDTVDGLLGRLEAALDSQKRFVANAAHELRTPLTLEHALLEEALIDPGATVDSFRANFEQLMAISKQQARLLESLLILATSERGLDRLETVNLAQLVDNVVSTLRPEARRRGLTFVPAIGPAWIVGDPVLVASLVVNLLDNAMAYNVADGAVEVSTGTAVGCPFLFVSNTGPVVPPEKVEQLFAAFQRLTRTADDGHHGLGLSIVQSIAVAHTADLKVFAKPEGGLVIRVTFPPFGAGVARIGGPAAADASGPSALSGGRPLPLGASG
jgi:signal transduction histidine kinase